MCDPKGEKNHGSSVAGDAKSEYSTLQLTNRRERGERHYCACVRVGQRQQGGRKSRPESEGTREEKRSCGHDRIQGEMLSKGRVVTRRFFHRVVAIENLHA